MNKINHSLASAIALIFLSACETEEETTAPVNETGNTEEVLSGGGAITFTKALAVESDNDPVRIARMQKLSSIAYLDTEAGSINYDYRHNNNDGYYISVNDGIIHTGIDYQGSPKNSKIGSLVNGKVVAIDTTYGTVVVETFVNNRVVRFGHMHLDPIIVSVGQSLTAGQEIGTESNKGLNGGAVHLHIEASSPCLGTLSTILDVNPVSERWSYALDPLEFADAISKGETSTVQNTIVFDGVSFINDTFVAGVQNKMQGCIYNPVEISPTLDFSLKDNGGQTLYSENHIVQGLYDSKKSLLLNEYHWGTETVFNNLTQGEYTIAVTVSDIAQSQSAVFNVPFSIGSNVNLVEFIEPTFPFPNVNLSSEFSIEAPDGQNIDYNINLSLALRIEDTSCSSRYLYNSNSMIYGRGYSCTPTSSGEKLVEIFDSSTGSVLKSSTITVNQLNYPTAKVLTLTIDADTHPDLSESDLLVDTYYVFSAEIKNRPRDAIFKSDNVVCLAHTIASTIIDPTNGIYRLSMTCKAPTSGQHEIKVLGESGGEVIYSETAFYLPFK